MPRKTDSDAPPKPWSEAAPNRKKTAARRVFDELKQDILDFDARKPEAKRMSDEDYLAEVMSVGRHLRVLFDQKIDDAAELKRRGREFLGLPKRLHKSTT